MCERRKILQRKINTKDKHYTVLGLTAISRKPVMCIIIFSGEQLSKLVETGLDLEVETVGHSGDEDFFENKSGAGKQF